MARRMVIEHPVHQLLRMFDAYTQGKGFGLQRNTLPVQQRVHVPRRVARGQNHRVGRNFFPVFQHYSARRTAA